jgi:copper(I)-binding protein
MNRFATALDGSEAKKALLKRAMMAAMSLSIGLSAPTVHADDNKNKLATGPLYAERLPVISDAWARATVPGQAVGAAYLKINSPAAIALTAIESSISQSAQVHSMAHHDGVMQMRRLSKLDIPAGQTVELTPGGNHIMLIGLKKPLKAGESIQLKLTFDDTARRPVVVPVSVPIRPLGK